ncbi:MAG: carboxylating nicotinate-nucleotide diphosphorylase [Ilumatobacteraceae bacterium]
MQYRPLSDGVAAHLVTAGLDIDVVRRVVAVGLDEDLADGPDITTFATVPVDQRSRGIFAARDSGCIAGLDVAAAVFDMVCDADAVTFTKFANDGDHVQAGAVLANIEAPTRGLLTGERTALNILCHLSGVASATAKWVELLVGTGASVRDTRKTTPGMRMLEKYAVRCGGGVNHRMSLSDAALVKDNHIVAAGGVEQAFTAVRKLRGDIAIEIEVDSLDQLRSALGAGADLVLLDNMAPEQLRQAVQITNEHTARTGKPVVVEASGGITLDSAKAVAESGVRYISVGALTHSSPVLDIGLDLQSIM